jgi:hypothetical protein
MADIPEEDLEETRAALAPTLEATAAILPWLAKPRPPRFDPELNQRWIAAAQRLAGAWSNRHSAATDEVRPAVFALYGIALETADGECLALGEALAGATDQLEQDAPPARLIAALTATIECLSEPEGLEHVAFVERSRHFAQRLTAMATLNAKAGERSSVLDRLFADEVRERIGLMHDALAVLPPDAYALKSEATQIAHHAEHLELYGIMHLASQLASKVNGDVNLDSDTTRHLIEQDLQQIIAAIAALDG